MQRDALETYHRKAEELLVGAIDMHIHSAPSVFARRADDRQTLAEAAAAGMKAVVLKSHEGDTVARVSALGADPKLAAAFGGVALNHFVGGLNPAAAEISLRLGGKVVWLPTVSAAQHVEFHKEKPFLGRSFKHGAGAGISLIDGWGRLVPSIQDIFDLVSDAGAIVCTGHTSPQEVLAAAKAYGSRRRKGVFVYTHPDLNINRAPLQVQRQVVQEGGYIEKCVLACHPDWGAMPVEEFIRTIREIGAERCFLSTDAGGPERPSSPETLRTFMAAALESGLTEREIRTMLVEVPARLLNLTAA
jgi:hypothetical protein